MNFIKNETEQKLRGGYYTPLDLAVFLTRWVKEINPRDVLEPSCGDGIFFKAFSETGGFNGNITGFELDGIEAFKARERAKKILPMSKVEEKDFLKWAIDQMKSGQNRFDAIIGNPPFIRYQYLPEIFQQRTEQIFDGLHLPFTKHTNAWVPFILASISLLRPGGRLAMVVPAEIMHIPHAQSLRSYLGKECKRMVIVDPEEIWFDKTLQGTVLLLAEKRSTILDKNEGLGIYPVKGREFLKLDPEKVFSTPKSINGKTISGKWTRALLGSDALRLLDEVTENPNIHNFKDIASVDVGIVTGANDYFLVSDEVVEKFQLSKWAHPMFGRSEHCPGIIYDEKQHKTNVERGKPTNFIWFPKEMDSEEPIAKTYITYGEMQNLQTRYKCRAREPWYSVPSVYSTEIGMLKRAHNIPRLILNKLDAFTTDTAYRIKSHIPAKTLVGSFINSLTALSAEVEGRHYGGGVLELVPSEIEHLLIPLSGETNNDLRNLDTAIKTQPTHQLLERQDRKMLSSLGLSNQKQDLLRSSWKKLHDRRQRITAEIN